MPQYVVTDNEMTRVANAIRSKAGITTSLTYPYDFINKINNITEKPTDTPNNLVATGITSFSSTMTAIGSYAFANCQSLRSVSCSLCYSISMSAFYYCDKLKDISFPKCQYIYAGAFEMCRALKSIDFPKCKSIGSAAFSWCTGLAVISLPVCTYIGEGAFDTAGSPNVTIKSVYMPEVTSVAAYAFNGFGLDLPSFSKCKYIGRAAFAHTRFESISFPVCTSLERGAFSYCTKLLTATFPVLTSIGGSAFEYCSKLTTVSFPACKSIESNAFYNCSALTTVSFPVCTSIGNGAFTSCSALTSVSFPACTSIGSYAFARCSALTTASFPACTTIGPYAFQSANANLKLYLLGNKVATMGYQAFYAIYSTVTIYVNSSLVNSYKTATNWASISTRIYAG